MNIFVQLTGIFLYITKLAAAKQFFQKYFVDYFYTTFILDCYDILKNHQNIKFSIILYSVKLLTKD